MLKQIQAKLEAKFPGLSKVFLGLIAAQMATKVTEESGIDAAIAELDNAPISITILASEFQKEGDRRVTDAEKTFKAKYKIPEPPTPPTPADPPKPVEGETETDKLLKQVLQEVAALKSEKVASATTAKAVGILKEKKVPESYYQIGIDGRTFKDEAEAEAYAAKVVEAYTAFNQQQVNDGLKQQPAPVMGVVTDPAKEVSSGMKEYLASKQSDNKKTA